MGCWNATCSISGLPIECGSEVYAAIVGIEQDPLNRCGPTSVAFPIAPMFEGTYNDYGGVEAEDAEAAFALKIANRCLKSTRDLDAMMQIIVQGDAKYVRLGTYPTKLGIWIAHKHIVEAIGGRDYFMHMYESGREVRLRADEFIAAACLGAEDFLALMIADDVRGLSQFWREISRTASPFQQRQNLAHLARQVEGDVNTRYWVTNLDFVLQDMHVAKEEPAVQDAFAQLGRTLHMTRAMGILRRSWMPATGEGSQDTFFDEHAYLATMTANFAKTLEERDLD